MPGERGSLESWAAEYVARPLAISMFFVLLALLWTFPLQHAIAYPFVFLFFAAVMCSAWFGGFIAGLMSVGMSSVLVGFFFVPPFYSMSIGREFRSFEAAFVLCAIGITAVGSTRKRSEAAIRKARDELELRVQERTAELQRSNDEVLHRERQLRTLTEAIPQQIWQTDGAGSVEYCNQDLLGFVGKPVEELLGDKFFDILHPEDAALLRESWEAARASGEKFELRARIRSADGRYRWFLIRANPQRSPEGTIACWYGVHIDIEEQQRAQRDLLEAQDHLSRLSRTLSMAEMAASIAHELNQPLTAVVNDAHACRRWLSVEPPNFERAVAAAERIVRESTRAGAVVKRVRSLFQKDRRIRESTDLNEVIQQLAMLLRDEALRRGVVIKLHPAARLPPVQADPVQLQQVVLNLAINGMEAMSEIGEPRELEIFTGFNNDSEIVVTVRDHGRGISEESRSRIFDPFFTTRPDGIGMGLAICRSIIEAHDGRIWVDAMDRGAAFSFALGMKR